MYIKHIKLYLFIFVFFCSFFCFSQETKTVTIGFLVDKTSKSIQQILTNLKDVIIGVVGQEAVIDIKDILINDFDPIKAYLLR